MNEWKEVLLRADGAINSVLEHEDSDFLDSWRQWWGGPGTGDWLVIIDQPDLIIMVNRECNGGEDTLFAIGTNKEVKQ